MMECIDIIADVIGKCKLEEYRKKFPDFDSVFKISNMLCDIGKKQIDPNSKDGKHFRIEIEECLRIFCQEYEQYGIKPKISLTWDLTQ